MTCDHGIRLDRYCGDCESGFVWGDLTDASVQAVKWWIPAVAWTAALLVVVLIARRLAR